jgi:uncharacterized protein (TIGR02266 family)
MPEDRRSAPRARISGARVIYESATGDQTETDALNLARGGLFVRAAKPLAVGKRLAIEIQLAGELVPWSALGRVVWIRQEDEGERRPPGMGIKLIDADDAVIATIDRLVAERAQTDPGVGEVDPSKRPVAATPIITSGPTREKTILGVGSGFPAPFAPPEQRVAPARDAAPPPAAPAREPSLAIDLVARERPSAPSSRTDNERTEETLPIRPRRATPSSSRPAPTKPGNGLRWLVVLIVLAIAAAAAYLLLGGDLDRFVRPSEPAAAPQQLPASPALPQPAVIATASGVASTATASAIPAPVSTPSTTAALSAQVPPASASASSRKAPAAAPFPPASHAPAARKPGAEDGNPY